MPLLKAKSKKINKLNTDEIIKEIVRLTKEHGQNNSLHVKNLRARAASLRPQIVRCY